MSERAQVKHRSVVTAALTGLCVVVAPLPAMPQTASEVTPQTFQPQLRSLGGQLVLSGGGGAEAPPGSEAIGVTLGGVALEGAFPEMQTQNSAFRSRLTSGRIPVSELFEAASDLEAAYAEAGFVLARVVIPQQSLTDGGTLRVEIVRGFIETVDASDAPDQVRERLEALAGPLLGETQITLDRLERQILLAGDTPGVALDSALATGERAGGTILSLDPEFRSITGFVGVDTRLPEDLDRLALSAGVEVNSPFQQGETFYFRSSLAPDSALSDDPRYRVLSAGLLFPVGPSGLSFNAEFTHTETRPDNPDAPTRSAFSRQSYRAIYPFIRSRQINLTGQASLDLQEDKQNFIGGGLDEGLFRDELSILRFGGTLSYVHDEGAVSQGGAVLSRGIDAFGARTAADAAGDPVGLSRDGADAEFTKLTVQASHDRALSDAFAFSVAARGQTSFGDPLPTSELIGITGPSELSPFESGDLRGDSGWSLRAELSSPRAASLGGQGLILAPYAFAAAGGISIERPTAEEAGSQNATAFGVGLDLFQESDSRFRGGSVRLEIGKGERNDGPDRTRFSLSGSFRF